MTQQKFGRYKFNKKLSLATRITNQIAYDSIIDQETGEELVAKDEVITPEIARQIQDSGINIVNVKVEDKKVKIIGNGTVDIHNVVDIDLSDLNIKEEVNYAVLKNILDNTAKKDLKKAISESMSELKKKNNTK